MRISLGENAKMALDTLRENKVRSFLTVLGVVIGITALITVASILVGFYADVTAYLDDYHRALQGQRSLRPGLLRSRRGVRGSLQRTSVCRPVFYRGRGSS